MKCYICGNKIKMDENIVKITYGQFRGNYSYAEEFLSATHSKYVCKDCAFERNLMDE